MCGLSTPGWLFLFAVLMAAGLLFCMVFFVRISLLFSRVILGMYTSALIRSAGIALSPPRPGEKGGRKGGYWPTNCV